MFATIWVLGVVSLTFSDPSMTSTTCEILRKQMEEDISQIYITKPEVMVQNGVPVPREAIWVTCEPKLLQLGFKNE